MKMLALSKNIVITLILLPVLFAPQGCSITAENKFTGDGAVPRVSIENGGQPPDINGADGSDGPAGGGGDINENTDGDEARGEDGLPSDGSLSDGSPSDGKSENTGGSTGGQGGANGQGGVGRQDSSSEYDADIDEPGGEEDAEGAEAAALKAIEEKADLAAKAEEAALAARAAGAVLTALPGDVYSFAAELNGVVYSLPAPYLTFMLNGWVARNTDLDEMTIGGGKVELVEMINGEHVIHMGFVNNSDADMALNGCDIGMFVFSESHKRSGASFRLPGGLTIGTPYDDIKSLYGNESIAKNYAWATILQYKENNSWLELELDADDAKLTGIIYTNFARRESYPEYPGAPPAILGAYAAPDALGEHWHTLECVFGGDIYRLPAPVEALTNNGWVFVYEENYMLEPGEFAYSVELRRDNQMLYTKMANPTGTPQPLKFCFALELSYDKHNTRVSLELPGGVSEESSLEEIIEAYGEPDHTDDSASMFIYYIYGTHERGIEISLSIEAAKIEKLVIYTSAVDISEGRISG